MINDSYRFIAGLIFLYIIFSLNDCLAITNNYFHYSNIKNTKQWERQKKDIQQRMQQIMGAYPDLSKKNQEVIYLEAKAFDKYTRYKLLYEAEKKSFVPAYLFIPTEIDYIKKHYGVLCLHQTNPYGNQEVAGISGNPANHIAVEIVKQGYVALCPAYPLMADYQPNYPKMGYESGSMKAIADNSRGLDFLDSLKFVKKENYGVIGHSLGGHNGIFTAVFDHRIKVVICSCGFDSFRDYNHGNLSNWAQKLYMPNLEGYSSDTPPFDFDEAISCIAPRSTFISAPLYDTNFMWWSVKNLSCYIQHIYELTQYPEHLLIIYPEAQHSFPFEVRQQAYLFLKDHLKNDFHH